MKNSIRIIAMLLLALASRARAEKEIGSMLDAIPVGEFWYSMNDGDGKPFGYARLETTRGDDGSLAVSWELKLAPSGGTYEETRSMVLGADGRLLSSSYHAFGNLVCSGELDGGAWRVTVIRDGKPVTQDAEAPPAGAMTGMGFVFASAVPREEGGRIEKLELDEANAFQPVGTTVFTWEGTEDAGRDGESVPVHRILLKKANGKEMPIDVAEDGRILRSDWGGGNVMVYSKTGTKELFQPPDPAIRVVDAGEKLVMRGELERFSPEEVFDHFVTPELLTGFWPQEAEIEAKVGGRYHLNWPGPGWKLLGEIREFERGRRFSFTWKWEHAPELPERLVTLDLSPRKGGGTVVELTQGPYGDSEDEAKEREGHVQGWVHVFGRLRATR